MSYGLGFNVFSNQGGRVSLDWELYDASLGDVEPG